ncbi:FxLD family lanthipeptide [Streptomyces massasporeus]
MAQAAAPLPTGMPDAELTDEWELDTTITHSPKPIVEMCGTGDGCRKTCASSCASS